jgi:hypothetical protein
MPKQCPECKKFMALDRGGPMEAGAMLWAQWYCINADCWQSDHPIPAPEYDWEHYGLSDQEIEILRVECPVWAAGTEAERDAYYAMLRSRYRRVF